MEKNNVWLITAKTNVHVGNENTSSYGLIDKAIQRDAITELPCINSSSLKGALNEFATNKDGILISANKRLEIFGADKSGSINETQKGQYTFFDAHLLLLPVPSENQLYQLITSNGVLTRFADKLSCFGMPYKANDVKELLEKQGYTFVVKSDAEFKELCNDYNLPIIARNKLENGKSVNLWYEQILPSESVLYTFIEDKGDSTLSEKLKDQLVQIGANATIGYGYCKFANLK